VPVRFQAATLYWNGRDESSVRPAGGARPWRRRSAAASRPYSSLRYCRPRNSTAATRVNIRHIWRRSQLAGFISYRTWLIRETWSGFFRCFPDANWCATRVCSGSTILYSIHCRYDWAHSLSKPAAQPICRRLAIIRQLSTWRHPSTDRPDHSLQWPSSQPDAF